MKYESLNCSEILTASSLSELKKLIERRLEEQDNIIIVTPYDTGIYYFIEYQFKNIIVHDYLKFLLASSTIGKRIIVLTPYQYKYLANKAGITEKGQIKIIQESPVIISWIKPIENNVEKIMESEADYRRNFYDELIMRKGKTVRDKEVLYNKMQNISVKINLPCLGQRRTLLPLFALEVGVERLSVSDIGKIFSKFKEKITRNRETLSRLLEAGRIILETLAKQGLHLAEKAIFMPIGISLGLAMIIHDQEVEHLKAISKLPYFKLEELEEEQGLPPGTITMAGRYTNPADLLNIIGETLGRKIENIEKIIEKLRENIKQIPEYNTLEKLQQSIQQLEDEINKIRTQLEERKKIARSIKIFKALPINNVDDLINIIGYQSKEGKLIDLSEKSKELRRIIDYITKHLEQNNSLIITGSSGVGKTTLLLLISKKLIENGYNVYYLVNPFTQGAIPLGEVREPAVFVYDNLLLENYKLFKIIFINKNNLAIFSTVRDYILDQLILKLNSEISKISGINSKDIENFINNNIFYLAFKEDYPTLLIKSLTTKEININLVNTILQKSIQKTDSLLGEFESRNLYYIIKIIDYFKKNKKFLKYNFYSIPNDIYQLLATEILHSIGIPVELINKNKKNINKIINDPKLLYSPIKECVMKQVKHSSPSIAFAKCYILFFITRLPIILSNNTIDLGELYEIKSIVKEWLSMPSNADCNSTYLTTIPHDSYRILLNPDPLDYESFRAREYNEAWKILKELLVISLNVLNYNYIITINNGKIIEKIPLTFLVEKLYNLINNLELFNKIEYKIKKILEREELFIELADNNCIFYCDFDEGCVWDWDKIDEVWNSILEPALHKLDLKYIKYLNIENCDIDIYKIVPGFLNFIDYELVRPELDDYLIDFLFNDCYVFLEKDFNLTKKQIKNILKIEDIGDCLEVIYDMIWDEINVFINNKIEEYLEKINSFKDLINLLINNPYKYK